jgi:hypothetical protein
MLPMVSCGTSYSGSRYCGSSNYAVEIYGKQLSRDTA